MKNLYKYLLTMAVMFPAASLLAQTPASDSSSAEPLATDYVPVAQRNIVKLSVTNLALRNFEVQYERMLSRRFSAALGLRAMPLGPVPLSSFFADQVSNKNGDNILEDLEVSSFSITPEFRFYMGKGYGKGFYLAPFLRFSKFHGEGLSYKYSSSNSGGEETITLSGDLTSTTGGLLIGSQFFLGKYVVLDWYILGPHYGKGKGEFNGNHSETLSEEDQQEIRETIEGTDIPLTELRANVGPNKTRITLDGPWGGIRAGISLGVRF
jgi:hypothetical protein